MCAAGKPIGGFADSFSTIRNPGLRLYLSLLLNMHEAV